MIGQLRRSMLSERKPPRFTFAPDAEQCPSCPARSQIVFMRSSTSTPSRASTLLCFIERTQTLKGRTLHRVFRAEHATGSTTSTSTKVRALDSPSSSDVLKLPRFRGHQETVGHMPLATGIVLRPARAHTPRFARASTASNSTCAPASASSGSMLSASLCDSPSLHGVKIIAVGTCRATYTASWPAPDTISRAL